jgi:hypothetical protein
MFRGTTYEIEVSRAGPGRTATLTVDGRPIDGTRVPLPSPGTPRVRVAVVLS